jgi:hypothetical protein
MMIDEFGTFVLQAAQGSKLPWGTQICQTPNDPAQLIHFLDSLVSVIIEEYK